MGQTLQEIAQKLKGSDKKVQLIYAFNGVGKTRLSREFKELIAPKNGDEEEQEDSGVKVLYYNAFTEDLFYWDNDLDADSDRKLIIQPNNFTNWVLVEQGQGNNIISNFQHYANDKLTPHFNAEYLKQNDKGEEITVKANSEVTFSFERGDDSPSEKIKISKGEESNFVWSVFYSLLNQVVEVLKEPEEDRETNQFNELKYIFIDDPVSSLDENHLIQLAVDLAHLIKKTNSDLKFMITTHNPLFYNVLHSELGSKDCYMLSNFEDGTFDFQPKQGDSNSSFSYHLHLKNIIEQAIDDEKIEKFHFTLLRNLYEKTASFLGFPRWAKLLPDDQETYYRRVIQFTTHSNLPNETVAEPSPAEKQTVAFLLRHLKDNYNFWEEESNE